VRGANPNIGEIRRQASIISSTAAFLRSNGLIRSCRMRSVPYANRSLAAIFVLTALGIFLVGRSRPRS